MLNKSRSNPLNVWKYATVLPLLTLFILLFNTRIVAQSMGPSTTNDTDLQLQIGPDATDAELQEQASLLKARGIEVEFKKIKRNGQGKITGIFSSFKDHNGHKGNYSVSGDEPIASFVLNISYENGEIDQIGYHTQSDNSTASATTITKGTEGQSGSSSVKVRAKTVQGDSSPSITTQGEINTVISVRAKDSITSSSGYALVGADQDPPLYIINGETATTMEIQNLPPDQLESIKVLKGKMANDSYGEAGKNGVIIISTKKDGTATSQIVTSTSQHATSLTSEDNPLIILDGKEVDKKQMEQLDPKTIESLVVLKDASAIAEYGEKGKNGVLIIRTKKED